MIIRRVRARNFMRYQDLHLADLPVNGAVAILGENESGKTTIGEAISFALFGETVKSRATDVSQVISWDAEEAETEIDFDCGARGSFRLRRRTDKRGGHDATLTRLAGDDRGKGEPEVVAEGPEEVHDALREATGLDFDEFRHSFYVAQAELGLVRRSDAEGDGRRVVQEIVGIGALERAAGAERDALGKARDRADELSRGQGMARAVAGAHRIEPGYGEELEREGKEAEEVKRECDRRIPELAGRAARLRDAEVARGEAIHAGEKLERAIIFGRAEGARSASRAELGSIAAGLEAEAQRLRRDLQHREKTLSEVRSRVDRLIDYQAKIAELEARLDLYKAEVKSSLDVPEIPDEDIEALEGLALPSTPAAGLKLYQARVVRLRRARSKAIARAVLFFVLAVVFALIGAPSIPHVMPGADQTPTGPIDGILEKGVEAVARGDARLEHAVWLGLTVAGCGFALLFFVLAISRLRRASERADQVKISQDAVQRSEKQVKDNTAERSLLEGLDLRKPLKFADAVKELRNQTVKDQFQKIRELHNDFVSSPEQRDALVAKERADEGKYREEVQVVESRLARVTRLARSIPADAPGAAAAAPIPEKLEAVEARVKVLLEQLEDADRDRREVERQGGVPGEAVALHQAVQEPLERAWKATGAETMRAQFLAQSKLQKLAGAPGELGAAELRQALAREQKLVDASLPKADDLRAERDRVEEERKALESKRAIAIARLSGLQSRLAEVRDRRKRFDDASRDAQRLEAELAGAQEETSLSELTAKMLEETAQDLRRRVGPMLARYAAAILPRLTAGRYRKVKVGPDLELKVYSPEKNDFVPLVDLSIGAADQLLIALRLAVGRALVQAKGLAGEKHFLFLDEPMASFDDARAKAFLEILRDHGDVFPQAFVVAHHHLSGLDEDFALVVTPGLGSRVLSNLPPDIAGVATVANAGPENGEATIRDRPGAERAAAAGLATVETHEFADFDPGDVDEEEAEPEEEQAEA